MEGLDRSAARGGQLVEYIGTLLLVQLSVCELYSDEAAPLIEPPCTAVRLEGVEPDRTGQDFKRVLQQP